MTEDEKIELTKLVNDSLDNAESVWNEVGAEVMANEAILEKRSKVLNASGAVPTLFPGHDTIEDGKPLVDEFIAFVLDIRESSKHLKIAISNRKNVSLLKRVYYETAAILPACSQIIKNKKGVSLNIWEMDC
jgi:hypothetical protein